MDLNQFIMSSLAEIDTTLNKALDGLSAHEMAWRPSRESNNIGFILWHISRAEDRLVNRFALKAREVYEAEGWYRKFGTEIEGSGYNFTAEQLESFKVPPLDELKGYGRAVRNRTLEFLGRMTPAQLAEHPNPNRPQMTLQELLIHLVVELSLHVGQIAYLRGMQRGLNK